MGARSRSGAGSAARVWAARVVVVIVVALVAGGRRDASAEPWPAWRVFTLLGASSDAVPLPSLCERADGSISAPSCPGLASGVRVDAPSCMTALDDAAFAVCTSYGLMRVDRDGSIHTWLAERSGARPPWGE